MSVNYLTNTNALEKKFEQQPPEGSLEFTSKDPHFFDFLKSLLTFNQQEADSAKNSRVELFHGVIVDWVEEHEGPVITLEDFAINPDAQLFLQVYGDALVEG